MCGSQHGWPLRRIATRIESMAASERKTIYGRTLRSAREAEDILFQSNEICTNRGVGRSVLSVSRESGGRGLPCRDLTRTIEQHGRVYFVRKSETMDGTGGYGRCSGALLTLVVFRTIAISRSGIDLLKRVESQADLVRSSTMKCSVSEERHTERELISHG